MHPCDGAAAQVERHMIGLDVVDGKGDAFT
jgi:hypothetical protein